MGEEKRCSKCCRQLALAYFGNNKNSKDGKAFWCRECCTEANRRYVARKKEQITAYRRAWYQKNREERTAKMREYYRRCDPEYNRWLRSCHYALNKEQYQKNSKAWCAKNRKALNAYLAARARRLKLATPPWADLEAITEFYRNCPPGHHVDHILPLNGKTVCGLHVIDNLQYLPAAENIRKGNKLVLP